jgi:propionyl-CoA carboxylase alpha chain
MFKKALIANRGEIACRVIRTARRMGIATVAVYSQADRSALHVEMADEAVAIGPAPAGESYLVIDKIIAACKQSGAQAVHPGYGFLSENAAFAEALEDAGIVFIGPPVGAITVMGDKIESKTFATKAGVNIVPGHIGIVADAEEAALIAGKIGYPVMIKASAGGGGKGMRVATNEAEAREGFQLATNEAKSSFGDDRIFIEKFIEEPRHIEIQVLADAHGNVLHLNERECSIQRRNQKVIEEAPSAFLDTETRAAMGAQAVALAKAVDYRSAGTVEFIVDQDRNFYFLEMNTRLQVEHPVTELITGIDLVEQMIRIAAGEPLGLKQDDIGIDGWAIEARVYAEDPWRGFLPSIGRLTHYRPPQEGTADGITVRTDTGVTEGSEISMFYDPMIAKLCAHADGSGLPARQRASDALADALDGFTIDGIRHNIPFLSALIDHPRWKDGRLSTAFIGQEYPDGFAGADHSEADQQVLALIAASALLIERDRLDRLSGRLAPHSGALRPDWVVQLGQTLVDVKLAGGSVGVPFDAELAVDGGEAQRVVTAWHPGERRWQGLVGGHDVTGQIRRHGHGFHVSRRGASFDAALFTPAIGALASLMLAKVVADTSKKLLCPMPGLVVSIAVAEGQTVEPGETLATVEAMKMENVLRAEREAIVEKILVKPGDSLAVDDVIMEFE